jgi:uncharacterized protein (DUF1501 family)
LRTASAEPDTRPKVLIAIFQRGGVDGLSMVIPHGDPEYYAARDSIAVPPPAPGRTEAALDLDGYFGLHPALAPLRPQWEARRLAVVHACGSPAATRSHFDAQDYMESGTPDVKHTPDGWLARALQARAESEPSPFRAVALGSRLPYTLRGEAGALAMSSLAEFDVRSGPSAAETRVDARRGFEALYAGSGTDMLHATGRNTVAALDVLERARPSRLPAHGAEYPRSRLGERLRQIAELICADIGLAVAFTDVGGWDTHVAQGGAQGMLATQLSDLAASLAALERDLGPRMEDVVVLTMSEFGRTVRENGGRGTDHGHGTAMLALGGPVRGGRVLGRWPGLERERLHQGRDLAVTTDFRALFAEIAVRHLGVPPRAPLFPGYALDRAPFPGLLA